MERQLVETARGLQGLGWVVHVVLFYPEGEFLEQLDEARIPWNSLRKRRRLHIAGPVLRLVRILRRERADYLYSFLTEPNIIATVVKPFVRPTKIVWGVRVSNLDLSQHGMFWRSMFQISRRMSRFPELIISNSEAGVRYHSGAGYPPSKFVVINNGIDVQAFVPNQHLGYELRDSWGFAGKRVVGVVAAIRPMKSHETFLRAAALVDDPDVRFVCVGSGSQDRLRKLDAMAAALGLTDRLKWVGDQREMPAVMNALDVLCLPSSDGEGFPNVLAEAMACGVPCVTTDVGDARRLVEGVGIVVAPNRPDLLAAALRAALAIERDESFVSRSRGRIVDHYSIANLARRTAQALEDLV